jgi:hypothetical protein
MSQCSLGKVCSVKINVFKSVFLLKHATDAKKLEKSFYFLKEFKNSLKNGKYFFAAVRSKAQGLHYKTFYDPNSFQ